MAAAGYKTGLRSVVNNYIYFRNLPASPLIPPSIEQPDYNVNKADQADYSADGLDGVIQATVDAYGSDGRTVRTVSGAKSVMSYNPLTDNWQQVPGEYVL